jgi:hypothetical protein
VHCPKRVQKSMAQASRSIRCARSIGLSEAVVDPGYEVARALAPQEEVKCVRDHGKDSVQNFTQTAP